MARTEKKDAMPHDVRPMLTRLIDRPFDRKGWLFEVKWDGYRAIAELRKGSLNLYSRNGLSFNGKYKPVEDALKTVEHDAVFDGEIIALKDGKPDFHTLQQYHEVPAPLQYAVFDLLYLDGKDLRLEPLHERKRLLKRILPKKSATLLYSEGIEEKGVRFFETMRKNDIEGMVGKDADSAYLEGKRTGSWVKVKNHNAQEAIIVGFTQPRGSRKNLGALVLGAYEHGKLVYIGHSGGGFSEHERADMQRMLSKIQVSGSPFKERVPVNSPITWVKPKYVCEMTFTEWTPGGHMRHPIYAGLRKDKKPKQVVREAASTQRLSSSKKIDEARGAGEKRSERYQSVSRREHRSPQRSASRFSGELKFTHLDKVFWPKEKYTKGDLIAYYERMADVMLPYLVDRPQNLNRHPNGIKGKSFYQKNITADVPSFVTLHDIYSESNEEYLHYLLCQNKETLLYLANLGCIEINPWNSRIQSLDKPDYMIIDLDPGENTFEEVVRVAQEVHNVLELARTQHYAKTSGKTGLHICVPLCARYSYGDIKTFAELIAHIVHRSLPELTSVERSPAKRKKKIYLDYLQNRKGQTIAAPYSVRPYPGATVSTPLAWSEVRKGLDPGAFTIQTIEKRLQKKGDLWAPMLKKQVDLAKAIECLQKELGAA